MVVDKIVTIKEKKGVPTVIEVNGLRYVLDHNSRFKGSSKQCQTSKA